MWKKYRKKESQEMRPYIKGESLIGISLGKKDIPEIGGMIARSGENYYSQRYISKTFFKENYELIEDG